MSRLFLVLLTLLAWGHCDARADDAPLNVLLIVSDDLNCDLGCYGHPLVKSPNIDRLAARGVRFERAYCQYPVCNPSRASFMTGLYPEQTGVLSNAQNFRDRWPELVTLPQHFRNHGYYAARVGKIYHYGVPMQIGTSGVDDPASWNEMVNPRGMDREVHDRIHTLQEGQFGGTLSWLNLDTADHEQTDGIGAEAAGRLLADHHPRRTGKPFFLAVGFYRPHTPYVAPSKYFDLYSRDEIEPVMEVPNDRDDIPPAALADRKGQRELTVDQRKEIIQAYYASISYMDAQVGRVLEQLEELELADRTVVVFTSDHGYHLGAHGLWQKGDLFEGSCHVPLIISVPGLPTAGSTCDDVAELVDLYPTLADVCGLDRPDHLRGISLKPLLEDPAAVGRTAAYTVSTSRGRVQGKRPLGRSLRTRQYRYTEWGHDGEFGIELYDYESDPDEIVNLARVEGHESIVTTMKQMLDATRELATELPATTDE